MFFSSKCSSFVVRLWGSVAVNGKDMKVRFCIPMAGLLSEGGGSAQGLVRSLISCASDTVSAV